MDRRKRPQAACDVHDHNPESSMIIGPFASRSEAERYINNPNLRWLVSDPAAQDASPGRSLNHVTAFDERNHFRGWGKTFNEARESVRIRSVHFSI